MTPSRKAQISPFYGWALVNRFRVQLQFRYKQNKNTLAAFMISLALTFSLSFLGAWKSGTAILSPQDLFLHKSYKPNETV